MKKNLVAAASVAALLLAGACGGSDRPSVDELADAIGAEDSVLGGGLDDDVAQCMAEVLHDSDVSDDTLNAIVEADMDYEGSDAEADRLAEAMNEATECVTEG